MPHPGCVHELVDQPAHGRCTRFDGVHRPPCRVFRLRRGPCRRAAWWMSVRPCRLHFVLDGHLELPDRFTLADVLHAMAGHVIARARLDGTYEVRWPRSSRAEPPPVSRPARPERIFTRRPVQPVSATVAAWKMWRGMVLRRRVSPGQVGWDQVDATEESCGVAERCVVDPTARAQQLDHRQFAADGGSVRPGDQPGDHGGAVGLFVHQRDQSWWRDGGCRVPCSPASPELVA